MFTKYRCSSKVEHEAQEIPLFRLQYGYVDKSATFGTNECLFMSAKYIKLHQ